MPDEHGLHHRVLMPTMTGDLGNGWVSVHAPFRTPNPRVIVGQLVMLDSELYLVTDICHPRKPGEHMHVGTVIDLKVEPAGDGWTPRILDREVLPSAWERDGRLIPVIDCTTGRVGVPG